MEDYLIEAKKKKEHLNPASRTRYLVQECCFFPRLTKRPVGYLTSRFFVSFLGFVCFFSTMSLFQKILLVISAKQPTSG